MNNKTQSPRISIEIINQIAMVKLSRADKHNALDMAMFYAIDNTIKQLKKNRDIRSIILSGEGKDFCSGLDIKAVMQSPFNAIKLLFKLRPWRANLAQRICTGWQEIAVPVIIVIHGRCWGGGLQIALGGDFRICQPNAELSIMESRWGIIPDMAGSLFLPNLINLDVAKELAMTAKIIDGNKAHQLGLVTHVTEEPMALALQLAEEISIQSPDSIAATKKLYNKSWAEKLTWSLARESLYQLKILLGKNSHIKRHNQTHTSSEQKVFSVRKPW
jgi:enoyl-CoA hydratase/carnithine racemase